MCASVCMRAREDRSVKSRGSSHQLARSCLSYGVSNARNSIEFCLRLEISRDFSCTDPE